MAHLNGIWTGTNTQPVMTMRLRKKTGMRGLRFSSSLRKGCPETDGLIHRPEASPISQFFPLSGNSELRMKNGLMIATGQHWRIGCGPVRPARCFCRLWRNTPHGRRAMHPYPLAVEKQPKTNSVPIRKMTAPRKTIRPVATAAFEGGWSGLKFRQPSNNAVSRPGIRTKT